VVMVVVTHTGSLTVDLSRIPVSTTVSGHKVSIFHRPTFLKLGTHPPNSIGPCITLGLL